MNTITLDMLPYVAVTFMLTLTRVSAMLLAMPALGEKAIPARIKIGAAFALVLVLYPRSSEAYALIRADLERGTLEPIVRTLFLEILIGVFIGLTGRLVLSALNLAGSAMATQFGLGFAQTADPTQGIQGAILASFLTMIGVTLIFVTDMHHLFLRGLYDSYTLFPPGTGIPTGDMAEMAVKIVGDAFRVGTQIAAPFIVFGLLFYAGLGILSKLMPQVQIFFLAMPANILLGTALMVPMLGVGMLVFLNHMEEVSILFLAP
ncbi:MAG: flagellar biosynthetic protein FliR [Pseudomonadota bacterium]